MPHAGCGSCDSTTVLLSFSTSLSAGAALAARGPFVIPGLCLLPRAATPIFRRKFSALFAAFFALGSRLSTDRGIALKTCRRVTLVGVRRAMLINTAVSWTRVETGQRQP